MTNEYVDSLIDPEDSLERQNQKLKVMVAKLMSRVEQSTNDRDHGVMHFERTVALEDQVRLRTRDLQEALDILNATNAQLAAAQRETEKARRYLSNAVEAIQEGFAIFDAHDQLVLKNNRFSSLLPDVAPDIVEDMKFEEYVKTSARSAHIVFPKNTTQEEWIEQRLHAHAEQTVNFTLELADAFWLQISEQRTDDGGTIVLQTDITDTMRLQHEERARMLDLQAKNVRETLEHIEQGVLIFDQEGRLAEWNEAAIRILHISPNLLSKGTRIARFETVFSASNSFKSEGRPQAIFDWLSMMNSRPVLRMEIETQAHQYTVFGREMGDGSCLLSFNDITKLRSAHKSLRHAYQTMEQSVSERTVELREARDAAERANASKSRFVAAASHDLLQPVNAAKLYISSLGLSDLNAKQSAIVGRISQSFQSVETILGALLDISKLESGRAVLNISDVPLNAIFERLTEEFGPIAQAKGITLTLENTDAIVRSDPVYLRRILQNLVSNAIRYTNEGAVNVTTKVIKSGLEVCVSDTGVGISEADQELVFKEFHRGPSEHTDETAMGLGLAIVERACAMLDHALMLESEVGVGTRFMLSLPFAEQSIFEIKDERENGLSALSMDNSIIMVIENDVHVRDAMERVLEAWGASPVAVASFDEALEQIEALGLVPDLFLVDYHLDNNQSGLDVISQLRDRFGPILAILLTADRSAEVQNQATERGVFVRHKPVDIQDLNRLIGGMITGQRGAN